MAEKTKHLPCSTCKKPVEFEYSINDAIWNRIVRGCGPEHDQEYLCVQCFSECAMREIRKLEEKLTYLKREAEGD